LSGKEMYARMSPTQRRHLTLMILLGATCLGALLYVNGLSSSLRLGNENVRGFLLVPSLPTPLYITMALVVLAGVGLTQLASFMQRRKRPTRAQKQRYQEPIKNSWQVLLSMITSGAVLVFVVIWLVRHGDHVQDLLTRLREIGTASGLTESTRSLLRQVDSPMAGYALFGTILIVYGGLALLALWVLCEGRDRMPSVSEQESPQTRRVRRAFTAGLHELRQHTDPRQAIIACYARLEHLLEDYGVPVYDHLTPQEYMGTALQGLDLPLEAFAGLVELFEQARYSLHPLDNAAREAAMTYLETLKTHLEWETALAKHA
jgi:hypothetical protein